MKNDYALGHAPDQGGPTRDSRALAIVHAALFDALNSVQHHYTPYLATAPNANGASVEAAVAQAGHDTLVHLYPSQVATFDAALADTLAAVPRGQPKSRGIAVGSYVAAAILAARGADGSDATSDYHTIDLPGHHQPDPLHPDQGFLGPAWGGVTPFAVSDVAAFRPPAPPDLASAAYAAAFDQVRVLGAADAETADRDGNGRPDRTAEQTQVGLFWGYDGSPGLGTPPRLYNQIVRTIAEQEHNTVFENARLFALVNLAMADGGICCWDVKYLNDFWRPVVAIRAADTDGNPDTAQEAGWAPLGAPRSNDPGATNFTPPFPAYTSGHATFGAATFHTLADFYGRDDVTFTISSDEFNGVTRDQDGSIRPVVTRTFTSFSAAAEENGQSRIYLGIHWAFDKVYGIEAGTAIADSVFANFLRPAHHDSVGGETPPNPRHGPNSFSAAPGDKTLAVTGVLVDPTPAAQPTDASLAILLASNGTKRAVAAGSRDGPARAEVPATTGVEAESTAARAKPLVSADGGASSPATKRDAVLEDLTFPTPDFFNPLSRPV